MSLHLYMQVGRCIITMNNMHDKDKFLRMSDSIEVHGLYIVHACKCAAGKFIWIQPKQGHFVGFVVWICYPFIL
jgi:hypothetical protein